MHKIDNEVCEYYNNCTNAYFQSELSTDSEHVNLVDAIVNVTIEEELGSKCSKSKHKFM